jgi:hypothetical protein
MPNTFEFKEALLAHFREAQQEGLREITITAGELHREVGGYPGSSHRLPVCCSVLRQAMLPGDEVVQAPPSGKGASLKIRYQLPRGDMPDRGWQPPKHKEARSIKHPIPKLGKPINPIEGKVACFIPCCGSKSASGLIANEHKASNYLPPDTQKRLLAARELGGFQFNTDAPRTTALELYTGSPYQTLTDVKPALYSEMRKGNLHLYIISAGYGVIDAREAVLEYDEEMKGRTASYWREAGLQDRIAEILLHEKPSSVFGYFSAESYWSHASSKYRYFFTEGAKNALDSGLKATQAGCFYRYSGRGVKAILNSLGRTFVEHFMTGFNSEFPSEVETNGRLDGNVTVGFDRFE